MLKLHTERGVSRPDIRSSTPRHLFRLCAVMTFMTFMSIGFVGVSAARGEAIVDSRDAGAAAQAFLASLDNAQRSEAVAAINAPDRGTWTYLAGARAGLRLGDLLPAQGVAFDRFLATAIFAARKAYVFSAQTFVFECLDPLDRTALVENDGALVAPMPGLVKQVFVSNGQKVVEGDPIVVLEAMKMQHTLRASEAGQVQQLTVRENTQVDAGHIMAVITPFKKGE